VPLSMSELYQSSEGNIAQLVSALGDHIAGDAAEHARGIGVANVDKRVEPGDYAETILAVAEEVGADMIVVGNRGLGPLRGMLVGSVSQKVVQHANCSVMVVR
ncbi:MAG TPA: universal stress protein, partial [Sinorhizobium sp.]|nr:universal stress protein [Sinorhizobium sp.]